MASVGTAYVDVKADLKGFDDEVENAGKGLISKFGGFAKSAGKVLAVGLAGAFAGGAVVGKLAIDAASDLNESISKVGVVFGDAGDSVVKFSKTTAKALGQSQRQSLEAAGTFGNLFRALGITEKQSASMSTSLVTLAGDLASFNNVDPATALDALRSGLVGETEPLRQFGVNINDATLRTKALELGLISSTKDALDPATKAQAAYALVMDQTSLAQGDFARTSGGLANQQRILKAQLDDLVSNLGQQLLPIAVELANFASTTLMPLLARLLPGAIDLVSGAFSFLADNVFPKIAHAFQDFAFTFGNPDVVIKAGGWEGVLFRFGAVARRVIDFVVATWPSIQNVIETVMAAVGTALAFVADSVLPRLVAGIQAAVEWIIGNWPKVQAAFQATVDWLAAADWPGLFDSIKTAYQASADWITSVGVPDLGAAWEWLQQQAQALAQYVAERWTDIQKAVDNVITYLKVLFVEFFGPVILLWKTSHDQIMAIVNVVWNQILAIVTLAINSVKAIIDIVLGVISGDWGRAWDGIKSLLGGAWDFMVATVQGGLTAIQAIVSGGLAFVAGVFSLVWGVIKSVLEGAWNGIKSAVQGGIDDIVGFIQGLPGRAAAALGGFFGAVFGPLVGPFVAAAGVIIGNLQRILDMVERVKNTATLGSLGNASIAADIASGKKTASGGLFTAPDVRLIGEAGTEAVINGNQAVRALWNLANMPAVPAAGGGGGGDTYNFNLTGERIEPTPEAIYDVFRRGELLRSRR